MNSLSLVREFHEKYDQPINNEPVLGDEALNKLRLDLLKEEVLELQIALENRDAVEVLDALTDIQYVLDGAYLSLGFHKFKDDALTEVHRSNLSKLGADGLPVKNAAGKVVKGPSYSPPDIARVMWRPNVGDRVLTTCGEQVERPGTVVKLNTWHTGIDVVLDEKPDRPMAFSLHELRPL